MDNVRENLGIDRIHLGLNLPQGFDGSGVVVGVIDLGFHADTRHPRGWHRRRMRGPVR